MNDTPEKPEGLSFEDLADKKSTTPPPAEAKEAASKPLPPKPIAPISAAPIPRPPKPVITAPSATVKPKIGGIKIGEAEAPAETEETAAAAASAPAAKKPDPSITFDEPSKAKASPSVIPVVIDAIAAVVAIGFTVVMALEILPFLK